MNGETVWFSGNLSPLSRILSPFDLPVQAEETADFTDATDCHR
jgi:hypothetical protein